MSLDSAKKKVTLPGEGNANDVSVGLKETFPKLSDSGGYEFMHAKPVVTKTWTHNDPQRPQNYLQLQFCITINNISYCLWIHHVFYYCKAFDPNPDLHANRWDLKRVE